MLDNMSVKSRLAVLVALLSVVMILVGVIGLRGMMQTRDRLQTVYADRAVPLVQLASILDNLHLARGRVLMSTLAEDPGKAAQEMGGVPAFVAGIDKEWSTYMATYLTEEEKRLAANFAENYKNFRGALDATIPAANAGDRAATLQSMVQSKFREHFDATRDSLSKLIELQATVAKAEYEAATEDYAWARNLSSGSIVLGLLTGLGLAWWIIRSITTPLGLAVGIAQRIAAGELTNTIPKGALSEPGQLLTALNHMQDELKQVAGQIKHSADDLAVASGELATSSVEISKSATVQSEASSSIAAAVEQMTVSISHIHNTADDTRRVTVEAGELSAQGANVTDQAAGRMRLIADTVNRSSGQLEELSRLIDQVSGIVTVIKSVADQTNLLALNAAIEAARAGEHGRGFAVVADEVRSLAERTAGATKEIGGMIRQILDSVAVVVASMQESVELVDHGVALSAEAGQVIADILNSTRQVVSAVNDISAALSEQSVASQDIARQIERIAQSTEENNAAIGQMASSSKHLNQLGASLLQSASRFKFN
ncbi:methyl-accepting chemotaxis protein [Chitinivorax sp. B]|uniref:methyl-accepting chemotaxis protein n=1 Tax=Chitinivorax sp. B TaxID=2502235 RepID=UPI001484E230|nr:methyl-accepting chemotaxis protein [Chitinivorax sp. B]